MSEKIVLENGKYTYLLEGNGASFTCQRYDNEPRQIFDKSVLCLFYYARELEDRIKALEAERQTMLDEMYRSDDLPDLVGSADEVGISLEDTDIV